MAGAFGGFSRIAQLAQPLLLNLEPEAAHAAALKALKAGLYPRAENAREPSLRTDVFGLTFANPLGMAAGFDKNGQVPAALLDCGFGFTEIGSVTPLAQDGNPRPRVFRLAEARGMINRLGFNNEGHDAVHARLAGQRFRGVLGLNVGANKESADRIADYALGIRRFADVADYITVNISSPNTPGLRALQGGEDLDRLLATCGAARAEAIAARAGKPLPLLLKVAPDLEADAIPHIVAAALNHGVDGLIVSNTTLARAGVEHWPAAREAGGLSGAPLFERATIMLARFYQEAGGRIPLIGVGGVTSGADALAKIEAGATLVQLYTGLVYGGFGLLEEMLRTLNLATRRAGVTRVQELTGAQAAEWAAKPL